jgi:hypothetical protein
MGTARTAVLHGLLEGLNSRVVDACDKCKVNDDCAAVLVGHRLLHKTFPRLAHRVPDKSQQQCSAVMRRERR